MSRLVITFVKRAAIISFLLIASYICLFTVSIYAKTYQVVASNNLLADLAREIGGGKVIVTPVVTASGCVHSYEPGAKDMKAVANAAIYIKEGLGDDGWADSLIKSSGGKGLRVISAGQGLNPDSDSHRYFDLGTIGRMVDNIAEGLSKAYPSDARIYRGNAKEYHKKLDQLRTWVEAETRAYHSVKLMCYSDAFVGFLEAVGLKPAYTVEEYHEQDVSPRALAKAAEIGKKIAVKAVIGDYNLPGVPRSLADEIGCKALLLYPTVAKGGSYITFYKKNLSMLVNGIR